MEQTLKEHLAKARAIRWKNTSIEKRKEWSKTLHEKRYGKVKRNNSTQIAD